MAAIAMTIVMTTTEIHKADAQTSHACNPPRHLSTGHLSPVFVNSRDMDPRSGRSSYHNTVTVVNAMYLRPCSVRPGTLLLVAPLGAGVPCASFAMPWFGILTCGPE